MWGGEGVKEGGTGMISIFFSGFKNQSSYFAGRALRATDHFLFLLPDFGTSLIYFIYSSNILS